MGCIQKIENREVNIAPFKNIGIIGDPGCDGLGTYNMKVFDQALKECQDTDLVLIVGDLVPTGSDKYYNMVTKLIESVPGVPVYVLPGNHDTGDYSRYFGLGEYALIGGDTAIIVLNNMYRGFTEEGISLTADILSREDVKNVYISFHIPLPNTFSGNSVSKEEAAKLHGAIQPHIGKVKQFICGHVHSRFQDEVWGIPMICTGGGGAVIEDVSENIRASDVNHHVVKLNPETGIRIVDLENENLTAEYHNKVLKNRLEESLKDELMAHLKYLMYAEKAAKRGMNGTENLFKALASSEYHHARNFFALLEYEDAFGDTLEDFIGTEEYEYNHIYSMLVEYSRETDRKLAEVAYSSARAAEKVHAEFLKRVDVKEDYQGLNIYVCPICGFIMEGEEIPDRCPVCGRPSKEFESFEM